MMPVLLLAHARRRQKAKERATAIELIVNRLSPQLRKRFLAAVEAAKGSVDIEALARAVQAGSVTQAELAAKLDGWPDTFKPMKADLTAGFLAGMDHAVEVFAGSSTVLRMDLINPYAVQYAERKLSKIVASYKENAKENIRTVITEAVSGKHTSKESAKIIKDSIGLTPQYERAVENLRDSLMAEGVTGDALESKVERYTGKLLRSRSRTIARTEIVQAQVGGQRALWDAAAAQGLFNKQTTKRVWKTNHEGETNRGNPTPCAICEPMDGQEVAYGELYEHPEYGQANVFGEPLILPLMHPNCLCDEVLVFE